MPSNYGFALVSKTKRKRGKSDSYAWWGLRCTRRCNTWTTLQLASGINCTGSRSSTTGNHWGMRLRWSKSSGKQKLDESHSFGSLSVKIRESREILCHKLTRFMLPLQLCIRCTFELNDIHEVWGNRSTSLLVLFSSSGSRTIEILVTLCRLSSSVAILDPPMVLFAAPCKHGLLSCNPCRLEIGGGTLEIDLAISKPNHSSTSCPETIRKYISNLSREADLSESRYEHLTCCVSMNMSILCCNLRMYADSQLYTIRLLFCTILWSWWLKLIS